MSKYIDADRLIEYLEKEADKEFKKTEENANSPVLCHFHNGCRMQALDTIDFIKELQQEQPSGKTCKDCGFYENNCPYIRGKFIPYPSKVCKDYTYSAIKEQEQLSEDLEKAAEDGARQNYVAGGYSPFPNIEYGAYKNGFIAGAEWKEKQDLIWAGEIHKNGYNLCKEQMLKDAVEGEVVNLADTYEDFTVSIEGKVLDEVLKPLGVKDGDRVRVIIIKEDKDESTR